MIGTIFALLLSATYSAALENDTIDVPLAERQVFLDNYVIAQLENLERTMHQPMKKGAVIRPDPALGEDFIQSRTAPIWDPVAKVFKFWSLYGPAELPGVSGYYESRDGLQWYKPNVGQIEYRGSRQNNYVAIEKEGRRHPITMVVHDGSESDPERLFKCFLPNVGFAVSPDGIQWKMLQIKPVGSPDNFSFSYDEAQHRFIATVKTGGPHGRAFAIYTSEDFNDWTTPWALFHADDLDQQLGLQNIQDRFADPTLHQPCYNIPSTYNVDVYMLSVFRYEGFYIGVPAMYHQTGKVPGNWPGFDDMPITPGMLKLYRRDGDWAGFHDVQLACSRDLKSWKRLGDRKPFIGSSRLGSGAYDTANIKPPAYPIVRDDELWMYYTGGKMYGVVLDRPEHRLAGAICLAVLRRDGFISLDAGEESGMLLTKPFVLHGTQLSVNVDTLKGALELEVLDGEDESVAVSHPIVGDQPRGMVEWQSGDLADLQGQTVRLRFTLRKAQFYSFWLDNTE